MTRAGGCGGVSFLRYGSLLAEAAGSTRKDTPRIEGKVSPAESKVGLKSLGRVLQAIRASGLLSFLPELLPGMNGDDVTRPREYSHCCREQST